MGCPLQRSKINLTSGGGRTIAYTSYNLPKSINVGGGQVATTFVYGADRGRIQMGGPEGTRRYLDDGQMRYERLDIGGLTTHTHYLYAMGRMVASYVTDTAGAVTINYLHHDHLGSIDTVTDVDGNVVERLSYDPHGKRRNGTSWADAATAVEPLAGHRGYTGHEHLDDVGLIHMNGRVYDPTLGRFLSADPTILHPGNLQSFNRYSYVRNNPLTFVDSTGFYDYSPDDSSSEPGVTIVRRGNNSGGLCLGFLCFGSDSSGSDDGLSNGSGGGSSDAEKKAKAERRRVAASQRASRRSQRSINQNQQAANRAERSNFKSPDKTSVASNNAWTVGERLGYWKWEAGRTADDLLEVLDRNGALSTTTWPARGAIEGVSGGSISDVVREIVMAAPTLRAESAVTKGALARGREAEARVLNDLGLTKNTQRVSTAEGNSIPDALTDSLSVEIKDAARVSRTQQVRIQTDAARAAGRESVLVTGEKTCVSGPCSRAFDRIIRRPDLGPQ